MKKITAFIMILGIALAIPVNARGGDFGGTFAGSALGTMVGGSIANRGHNDGDDRHYVRQLERENDELRRRLERLEDKLNGVEAGSTRRGRS